MIEARLLSARDGLVGIATLIAIVILALSAMVRAAKREDVLRHLGAIMGVVILLIMLPPIIVSLWSSMTLERHLGIATILVAIIFLISATHRKLRKTRR